jgi:hypothetical protein
LVSSAKKKHSTKLRPVSASQCSATVSTPKVTFCIGAGHDNIGIRAMATKDARTFHFRLSVHGLLPILRLDTHSDFP